MLLPLGGMEAGYNGYCLAMIIGLLAGTLGGAAMGRDVIDFNHDDDIVTNTGQGSPRSTSQPSATLPCSSEASMRWYAISATAGAYWA